MNFKNAVIFFCCGSIAAVTLRTFMIFFTVESPSGFFKPEYALLSYLMLFIIIAVIALSALFAHKSGSRPGNARLFSLPAALFSLLLGLSVIYESLRLDYSQNAPMWQNMLQSFFGLLAGAVFIWFAASCVFPRVARCRIALITTVLYFMFRVIVVFITYSDVSTIADNVFELASLCLSLLFLLQFSMFENAVNLDSCRKKLLPYALGTCIINFTQAIPKLIALFSGNDQLIHSDSLFAPTVLLLSGFILCYTFARLKTDDESAPPQSRYNNDSDDNNPEPDGYDIDIVPSGGLVPPDFSDIDD